MGSNKSTLQHMYEHCQIISEYLCLSNIVSFQDFLANRIVQDAVLMRLLAIGELTTHLSDDFKTEFATGMDWRNIKQLRNVIAHRYGSIQYDVIWDIIQNDVPVLKKFCLDNMDDESEDDEDDWDDGR